MRFTDYKTYWESAARSNKMIGHLSSAGKKSFEVMDIEQIYTSAKLDGMSGLTMIMENPEIKPNDLMSDNIRKMISGGLLIIREYKAGDFAMRDRYSEECEIVCEQLMAKVRNDVRKWKQDNSHPHKIKGVDVNSMGMNKVSGLFGGYWIGWRLTITLNQTFANGLLLNADDWYNDTPAT